LLDAGHHAIPSAAGDPEVERIIAAGLGHRAATVRGVSDHALRRSFEGSLIFPMINEGAPFSQRGMLARPATIA